jgi:hypothetical protein
LQFIAGEKFLPSAKLNVLLAVDSQTTEARQVLDINPCALTS